MSKFPYAWSESEKALLEAEDIRDRYAQYESTPKDLRCPDESCRHERPLTTLIPICCNPEKPCSKGSPHIRTHAGDAHSDSCLYAALGKQTEYIVSHKQKFRKMIPGNKNNLLLELDALEDTSLLADAYIKEFNPRTEIEEIKKGAITYRQKGFQKGEALCMARCIVPQRTSKLERIINMAEVLEETNERDKAHLAIPGRPETTYEKAFLSIYSLKHDYTTSYIYCGVANVLRHKNEYIIRYKRILDRYHPDYPALVAMTPINSKLYRPAFLRELAGYADSGGDCYVYSFSTHCLKADNCPLEDISRWVLIEPIARDAVVIRNRCLNRSRNKIS